MEEKQSNLVWLLESCVRRFSGRRCPFFTVCTGVDIWYVKGEKAVEARRRMEKRKSSYAQLTNFPRVGLSLSPFPAKIKDNILKIWSIMSCSPITCLLPSKETDRQAGSSERKPRGAGAGAGGGDRYDSHKSAVTINDKLSLIYSQLYLIMDMAEQSFTTPSASVPPLASSLLRVNVKCPDGSAFLVKKKHKEDSTCKRLR